MTKAGPGQEATAISDRARKPIASVTHELLVQSVVDYAIYILDPLGTVASWNPGAERIKGYTPDEIIGEHFSRFYTEEDRDAGLPGKALAIAAETGRFSRICVPPFRDVMARQRAASIRRAGFSRRKR